MSHKGRVTIQQTSMGRGVFAAVSLPAESEIGEMRGRVTTGDDYDPDYCVDMEAFGVLVPTAPFRFLNHSCEPNCEIAEVEGEVRADGVTPRIFVFALRPIAEGEQLTIDYAWPADAAIECLCGTRACRGFVVDPEELFKVAGARAPAALASVRV